MCDEKKILVAIGGLDANVKTLIEQQGNIYERLGKLEQKNPVCSSHKQIIDDIDNLKSWKNKSIGVISVISTALAYMIYLISKYIHFPPK